MTIFLGLKNLLVAIPETANLYLKTQWFALSYCSLSSNTKKWQQRSKTRKRFKVGNLGVSYARMLKKNSIRDKFRDAQQECSKSRIRFAPKYNNAKFILREFIQRIVEIWDTFFSIFGTRKNGTNMYQNYRLLSHWLLVI